MDILVYVILLLALALTVLGAVLASRSSFLQLRRISAYNAMPLTVGEAVESEKAVHVSFGSSAIRDTSTISAIATADILYYLSERAALADKSILVTMSDPVTLALGQDVLRRAYKARDVLRKYRTTMSRWYPQGPLSLAFAAGVGAAILDEDVSTNILTGRYGPELMLMTENALRYDRYVIAQSEQIDGQAVAYAVSDSPLIGEELYAAGAYLSRRPIQIGGVFAQDAFRIAVVALILGLFVLTLLGVAPK